VLTDCLFLNSIPIIVYREYVNIHIGGVIAVQIKSNRGFRFYHYGFDPISPTTVRSFRPRFFKDNKTMLKIKHRQVSGFESVGSTYSFTSGSNTGDKNKVGDIVARCFKNAKTTTKLR